MVDRPSRRFRRGREALTEVRVWRTYCEGPCSDMVFTPIYDACLPVLLCIVRFPVLLCIVCLPVLLISLIMFDTCP